MRCRHIFTFKKILLFIFIFFYNEKVVDDSITYTHLILVHPVFIMHSFFVVCVLPVYERFCEILGFESFFLMYNNYKRSDHH